MVIFNLDWLYAFQGFLLNNSLKDKNNHIFESKAHNGKQKYEIGYGGFEV